MLFVFCLLLVCLLCLLFVWFSFLVFGLVVDCCFWFGFVWLCCGLWVCGYFEFCLGFCYCGGCCCLVVDVLAALVGVMFMLLVDAVTHSLFITRLLCLVVVFVLWLYGFGDLVVWVLVVGCLLVLGWLCGDILW